MAHRDPSQFKAPRKKKNQDSNAKRTQERKKKKTLRIKAQRWEGHWVMREEKGQDEGQSKSWSGKRKMGAGCHRRLVRLGLPWLGAGLRASAENQRKRRQCRYRWTLCLPAWASGQPHILIHIEQT